MNYHLHPIKDQIFYSPILFTHRFLFPLPFLALLHIPSPSHIHNSPITPPPPQLLLTNRRRDRPSGWSERAVYNNASGEPAPPFSPIPWGETSSDSSEGKLALPRAPKIRHRRAPAEATWAAPAARCCGDALSPAFPRCPTQAEAWKWRFLQGGGNNDHILCHR